MFLNVSLLFTTNVLIHKLKLSHMVYFNELFDYPGSCMEILEDSKQRDYVIMPTL